MKTSRRPALAAFAVAVSALLIASWTSPASAAWSKTVTKASGSLGMAAMGHTFTPIQVGALLGVSSGTGGSTLTSTWFGLGGVVYADLTNNSAVSTVTTGSVATELGPGVSLFPSVGVKSCPGGWNMTLNTCTGGATTLLPLTSGTSSAVSWGTFGSGCGIAPSDNYRISDSREYQDDGDRNRGAN